MGYMRSSKNSKEGRRIDNFYKKEGMLKRRYPAKVGVWLPSFFGCFECDAPTPKLTSKLKCCSSNQNRTPRIQIFQKYLLSASHGSSIISKYPMDLVTTLTCHLEKDFVGTVAPADILVDG